MCHRPVLGLLIAVAAASAAGSALAGTNPPIQLRLVAYNVKQGFDGPGSPQFMQAGRFITNLDVDGGGPLRGLNPDIVLLQECNQANIQEVFEFRDAYLPGYDLRTSGGDGFNYNTTLVRPGITVVSHSGLNVGGPRQVGKTRIRLADGLKDLVIYNCHFKSGSSSSDISQRTGNANSTGNNASFEINFGNAFVIVAGDLNSNNNSDGSLTGLFSAGVLNLPVESLAGAANPNQTAVATFPSSGGRLDYVCLDNALATEFDANMNGSYSQTELNSMGFVYFSQDDNGLRSSGDNVATSFVSDHRPVVFDVRVPRDQNAPYFTPTDVDRSGATTIEDLYQWETLWVQSTPPAPSPAPDVNQDRHTDLNDRATIRSGLRSGEVVDITTL